MVQNPLNNSDIQQEIDDLENSVNDINANFDSNVYNLINTSLYSTVSDLDTVNAISCFTDGSTLNTPYKQGITQGTQAFVITSSFSATAAYSTQLAIVLADGRLYTRTKDASSNWREWVAIS